MCWALHLAVYDFDVVYWPEKANYLSRYTAVPDIPTNQMACSSSLLRISFLLCSFLTTPHQRRPSCSTSGTPTDTTLIPIENTNKLATHHPHLRLGFEREKIVLNRASSCRSSLLFAFCFKRKALVMNTVEALENIAKGAEELRVGFVSLDLESVRRLMAACCASSSMVKKVDLSRCFLDHQAAEVIASSLRGNNVITRLILNLNEHIGSRGAEVLGQMLCLNLTLSTLRLYGCSVGDEGAGHLAVALRQNRTLEELWCSGNDITHVGASAIAAALPFNQTLKCLDLLNNPLGDDGVEALAKAVPCSGLHDLWLTGICFGERGCAALVEMLKNGSRLRALKTDSLHLQPLVEGYQCNGWLIESAPYEYLERNKAMLLRARKSVYTLLLIRKLRRTALSSFPKEVVREIAQFLYSCRGEVSVWDLKVARQEQRTGCLCF
jgi:hypothetical protein